MLLSTVACGGWSAHLHLPHRSHATGAPAGHRGRKRHTAHPTPRDPRVPGLRSPARRRIIHAVIHAAQLVSPAVAIMMKSFPACAPDMCTRHSTCARAWWVTSWRRRPRRWRTRYARPSFHPPSTHLSSTYAIRHNRRRPSTSLSMRRVGPLSTDRRPNRPPRRTCMPLSCAAHRS